MPRASQLVAFHHLDVEQTPGDRLQLVALVGENQPRRFVRFGDDALDLDVIFWAVSSPYNPRSCGNGRSGSRPLVAVELTAPSESLIRTR